MAMTKKEADFLVSACKTYIDERFSAYIQEGGTMAHFFEEAYMKQYNGGMPLDQQTFRLFLRVVKYGNGILRIEKTSTIGLVDVYTIYYTDGSTSTFQIHNGRNGEKGDKGDKGDDGKSAYEQAREGGYPYSEEDFEKDLAGLHRNAYKRITKIADYLYLTEYAQEDIDYSNADNTPVSGGCSFVRQGNVWTRNLDWYWNNDCEFIVKTNAHRGRFASIGVASVTGLTKAMVESGEYSDLYKIVPLRMVDGINTARVGVCTNVVPNDYGTTNQERGKQKIKSSLVARYILDNHASAYQALCDIRDNFDMVMVGGMEVHWTCGDATHTYLLEYINGEGIITDITAKPLMTNFHLYGVSDIAGTDNPTLDWDTVENHGMGLERYDLIRLLLQSGMNIREFMPNNLLYSNAYTSVNPLRWKTEFTGETETFGDITIHSTDEEFMPVITEGRNRYEQGRNGGAWITCHTSVYDVENMVLYIHTQEGEAEFKFYLDPHYCEIDDSRVTTEKTWSSSKISTEIAGNKPVWGSIEGEIDNQTDLNDALTEIDNKADTAQTTADRAENKAEEALAGIDNILPLIYAGL